MDVPGVGLDDVRVVGFPSTGRRIVSGHTARTQVSRILAKLDLRDRVQAVVLACKTGLTHQSNLTACESL
jgi:hypothetical protein